MSNFYLGFKGNVFSKMFMMFAIFMAMSSNLLGGVPTFKNAETMEGSTKDGVLDYIKVEMSEDVAINFDSQSNLKALFSIEKDDNLVNIDGIYKDTNDMEFASGNVASILYIKITSLGLGTDITPPIFHKRSTTTNNIKSHSDQSSIGDWISKATTDNAIPVLMSVTASSVSAENDTVTLNFSEKVSYVTGKNHAQTNITIKDGATDSATSMSGIIAPDTLTGSNTVGLEITDGLNPGEYISGTTIKVNIADAVFKDLSNLNLATSSKSYSGIVTESTNPKAIPSGTTLSLDSSPAIVLKVDEKLNTPTGIKLEVKTSSGNVVLSTSPTYTDKTLTLALSEASEVMLLREILGTKNTGDTDIKIVLNNSGTAKDALNNVLSVGTEVSPAYTKDSSKPTMLNVVYSYPNKLLINFSDGINRTANEIINDLDIKYSDGVALPSSTQIQETKRQIVMTFATTQLTIDKTINVKTRAGYSNTIVNYTGLFLDPITTVKTALIGSPPPIPTHKSFTLNMKTREIVVDFENTTSGVTMSVGSFAQSAVSIGYGSSTVILSSDRTTIGSTVSETGALVKDSAKKKLTITLGIKDLERLKVLLRNETDISKIKLNMGAISSLKNNYDATVPAKTDIPLATSGFIQDDTKPTVSEWSLNLDTQKMNISFNKPIAFTGTLDDHFSITKKSSTTLGVSATDLFRSFNTLDVGVGIGNTSVSFSTLAGDNNKTLVFDLNNSFVNEILNDSSLATSKNNAYLTIRSGTIKNISEYSGSDITITETGNLPRKLDSFTANKGNVNILFTRDNGVKMLTSQTANSSDELKASKWFMKTIPSGVSLTQIQLNNSFDRVWTKVGDVWKNAGFTLSSTKGYWLRSINQPHRALVRATLDVDSIQETEEAFKTRIKGLDINKYMLVGITRGITRVKIREYIKQPSCVVYLHTYTPSESASVAGEWDKATELKAGDALWVKQNCNNTGALPPQPQ